jgi:hypothetical protein
MTLPKPIGPGRYKCKFTLDEDVALREIVNRLGTYDWSLVASQMPGRTARQCRERWNNYVNPTLENVPWTPEEDLLLDAKFELHGTKWQVISTFFPSRSRNDIIHHWLQRQRKLARANPSKPKLPEMPVPTAPSVDKPRREGIEIAQFSLSVMVPFPIVPRGNTWRT